MTISPLIAIAFTLLVSFLFSELAKHFHYPRVLGQLIAGIVVSIPLFRFIITEEAIKNIQFLSQLGVIFLFVVIGIQTDLKKLSAEKERSLTIAFFTILVPLIAGYALGQLLDYTALTSFVLGICLAISSGTTNAQVFFEMKIARKPLAKVLLGAAIFVDLFAILFMAFLIPYIQGDLTATERSGVGIVSPLLQIPLKILIFTAAIWGLTKLMPLLLNHIERDESRVSEVSMISLFGLILAVLSAQLGLGEMIGAFFAGLILQQATRHHCVASCQGQEKNHRRYRRFFVKNVRILKVITKGFIIPILLIYMGMNLDLSQVTTVPWVMLSVIGMGVLSKWVAALVTKPFVNLDWAQTDVVRWAMNARGTMELVIAELTLRYGIISSELYTALVLMVVVTTLMLPFFLKQILQRNPHVMELR
jgi:Kef-type K+ transport system membrane component KefB